MMMMRRTPMMGLLIGATMWLTMSVSSTEISYSYSGPGSPPTWHVGPGGSFSYSGSGPIPPEVARFLPPGIHISFGPMNPNTPNPNPNPNFPNNPNTPNPNPNNPNNPNPNPIPNPNPNPTPNPNNPDPNNPTPGPPQNWRADPGHRQQSQCQVAADESMWWNCVSALDATAQCCDYWNNVKKNCFARVPSELADQVEPRLSWHCNCDKIRNNP